MSKSSSTGQWSAHYLSVNFGVLNLPADPVADQKIVNAPSRIVFSGVEAVRPPGILDFFRIQATVGINEPRCQQLGKAFSFLIGKASVFAVGFRVFQVNLRDGPRSYPRRLPPAFFESKLLR